MIRVTVWNEFIHEQTEEPVKKIYPNGIHQAIADFLKTDEEIEIRTATQQDPEHGFSQKMLDETDVLIYWAHVGHAEITYEEANRVKEAVLKGMGIIFLHSAHASFDSTFESITILHSCARCVYNHIHCYIQYFLAIFSTFQLHCIFLTLF